MRINLLTLFLRFGLFTAIIIFMVFKYDWPALWVTMKNASPAGLSLAGAVFLGAHVAGAARWRILYASARIKELLAIIFISCVYSTVLPGQIFGEASKVSYLNARMRKCGARADFEEIAASVVMDKFIGFLGLFIVGCISIILGSDQNTGMLLALAAFLFVSAIFVLLLGLPGTTRLLEAFRRKAEPRATWLARLIKRVQAFLENWRKYLKQPSRLAASMGVGIIYQLLIAFSLYCVGRGIGLPVPYLDWCWINAVLSVVLLLPVSVAGLGVRDASLAGMLALLGVNAPDALGCSLLLLGYKLIDAGIGAALLATWWDRPVKQTQRT